MGQRGQEVPHASGTRVTGGALFCYAISFNWHYLVSVAKGKIVRWNRGFWLFFSASFACHLMWGLTHLCDDSRQDRISCRDHSLDGERGGRAVAGVSWFAEFSPQSVHAGELPGVFVRRAASQPRSLRPAQRTPVCGLRSRRPCGRGAPLRG